MASNAIQSSARKAWRSRIKSPSTSINVAPSVVLNKVWFVAWNRARSWSGVTETSADNECDTCSTLPRQPVRAQYLISYGGYYRYNTAIRLRSDRNTVSQHVRAFAKATIASFGIDPFTSVSINVCTWSFSRWISDNACITSQTTQNKRTCVCDDKIGQSYCINTKLQTVVRVTIEKVS